MCALFITSILATKVKYLYLSNVSLPNFRGVIGSRSHLLFFICFSLGLLFKRISTSRQRFVMKINATFPDSVLQQWLSMSTSKFEVFWPPITSTTSCTMEARLSLFSFIGYRRTICNPSLFVSSFCEVDYLCISKLIHF